MNPQKINLTSEEFRQIEKKNIIALITQMHRQVLETQVTAGNFDASNSCDELIKMLEDHKHQKKESSADWVMVTVNPKADTPFDEFDKLIRKCLDKKWLHNNYLYSIEQRRSQETPDVPLGIHVHMLLATSAHPPAHIKREIRNTFKNIVGNENNPHTINFKFIRDQDVVNTVGYLLGNKEDPEKQEKVEFDHLFRQSLGLLRYYHGQTPVMDKLFNRYLEKHAEGLPLQIYPPPECTYEEGYEETEEFKYDL